MPELITRTQIKGSFALINKYGETKPPWPKRTILLYKSTGEWKRIYNKPPPEPKHAERMMCESLIDEFKKKRPPEMIEVILNYSPCSDCCEKLVQLKEKLGSQMKITFSNFYKGYDLNNLVCLSSLIAKGIDLKVFKELNDWKYLLEAANFVFEKQNERLCGKDIYDRDINCVLRNDRQKVDESILGAVNDVYQLDCVTSGKWVTALMLLGKIGKASSKSMATKIRGDLSIIVKDMDIEFKKMSIKH